MYREEMNQVLIDLGGGIAVQVYRNGRIGCTVDGVSYTSAQPANPRMTGLAKLPEKAGYVQGLTPVTLLQNKLSTQTVASEFIFDQVTSLYNGVKLLFHSNVNPDVTLHYRLTPNVYRLENEYWRGFGISYKIEAPGMALSNLFAPTTWSLGKSDADFETWGHTPYGNARGFHNIRLTSGIFNSEKLVSKIYTLRANPSLSLRAIVAVTYLSLNQGW